MTSYQKFNNRGLKLDGPYTKLNSAFGDTMPLVDHWITMGMARLLNIRWINGRLGSGYRLGERQLSASVGVLFHEQAYPYLPSSRTQVWANGDYHSTDCEAAGRYLFERDH